MAKPGPPETILDWSQIEAMCKIHCTGEEISSILSIDYDTLNRICKNTQKVKFTEYYKKHASGGKAALRRVQMKTALDGNATMQIWLGKQNLGQQDKAELDLNNKGSTDHKVTIEYVNATPKSK